MARNFSLPGRSAVRAKNGMISTSHPLATAAGLKTLVEGGSAIDAAISAAALLSVATDKSAAAEIAASIADPPSTKVLRPAAVAKGCEVEIMPFFARTAERPGREKLRAIGISIVLIG